MNSKIKQYTQIKFKKPETSGLFIHGYDDYWNIRGNIVEPVAGHSASNLATNNGNPTSLFTYLSCYSPKNELKANFISNGNCFTFAPTFS